MFALRHVTDFSIGLSKTHSIIDFPRSTVFHTLENLRCQPNQMPPCHERLEEQFIEALSAETSQIHCLETQQVQLVREE